MQVHKFRVSCPLWALPREEIPIHVRINKDVTPLLKDVKIDLPRYFKLVDTINLTDHKIKDERITVNAIGKARKSDFDYFGIVIATMGPFTELKKEIPINIEFEYNDGTKENVIQNARVFRPLLAFESIPESIVLSDKDKNLPKIPISLKFTGFGEISLRIECQIAGKIVSVGTSMLDEILRRILNEGIVPVDEDENTVRVDQGYVENMANQLREKLRTDKDIQQMIREQQISKNDAAFLYELSNEKREKFVGVLFKTVENYLIKIVSDILGRNLSNNLQIESQTKIHTQMQLSSTNVTIKFFYRDLLGNEYEPIEKIVQINDERKNPSGFDVEIPLEVTGVDESKAYKNVGAMTVGAHS